MREREKYINKKEFGRGEGKNVTAHIHYEMRRDSKAVKNECQFLVWRDVTNALSMSVIDST